FKKWFFDVSDGADDYLILFVSQIKLGKRYFTSFQMHGTKQEPNKDQQTSFACLKTTHKKNTDRQKMVFEEGVVGFNDGDGQVSLDFKDYRINLDYRGASLKWPDRSPLYSVQKTSLDWIPLILSGKVTGTIQANGPVMIYQGSSGYCDEVVTDILPWKVPVSRLYWGRLIDNRVSLTYSILQARGSVQKVSRLFMDVDGNQFIIDNLSLEILKREHSQRMNLNYPERYIIRCQQGKVSVTLEISGHQEMVLNDFMDYRKVYGRLATGLLRWISRNPKGIKFRASVKVNIRTAEKEYLIENARMIDEYVEFR
ncbi:MAG: hypothetical protein WCW62_13240, partial [Bacteroidales bacterium]